MARNSTVSKMRGFLASTSFSPSCTSSTRKHPSQGLLAALMASVSHLVAKLKLRQQDGSPLKVVTKARRIVHGRNNRAAETGQEREDAVWRKAILMGDKCQPLDFSGVIYYDESGKRVQEPPLRSRRSPLPTSHRLNHLGPL